MKMVTNDDDISISLFFSIYLPVFSFNLLFFPISPGVDQ